MEEEKSRLARLTAILTQLQSKRMITARELAEKHGVSIRTIYRDIRSLESSGIPILTHEGKGYSMMHGYKLPPIMFTEEEANALITAEHLINKNRDESLVSYYQSAITKIKATLQHNQQSKTELLASRMQIRNNSEEEKTSNYLIQLQSAIANYTLHKISYLSLDGILTERTIEPFAIYTTKGNWILIAFCRKRNDFRAFRLDRIQTLSSLATLFEPHNMSLEEYLEECRKKYFSTPDTPLTEPNPSLLSNHKNDFMQTVKIEPFHMLGISIITSNKDGQALKEIGDLWGRFISENISGQIPNKVDDTVYSLYTDYEGDHTKPYRVILGCKVSSLEDVPEGMLGRTFDGGNYAQFTAKGNLNEGLVGKKWFEIWQMDLNRAYTADFEVFGEKALNPTDAEVDFLIAIN